jgi:hypothetical protein
MSAGAAQPSRSLVTDDSAVVDAAGTAPSCETPRKQALSAPNIYAGMIGGANCAIPAMSRKRKADDESTAVAAGVYPPALAGRRRLRLTNLCSRVQAQSDFADIASDVLTEAARFGPIQMFHMCVDGQLPEAQQVTALVTYGSDEGALRAHAALDQRWFNRRHVNSSLEFESIDHPSHSSPDLAAADIAPLISTPRPPSQDRRVAVPFFKSDTGCRLGDRCPL